MKDVSAPTTQASPEFQQDQISKVTWITLAANALLSMVKLIGGLWGNSQAVVADAVHSFSDCATDIAILIGVKYWSQPPDEDHPYGHRRIETVVTIFIGLALALVAFGLMYDSIHSLTEPSNGPPGLIALGAALLSIATKELMYHWTKTKGKKLGSSALIANAWHQRTDALSSIPTAISVVIASIYPSLAYFDAVGALLVSLFILHAAWRIVTPGIDQLVDRGARQEDTSNIEALSMSVDGVRSVHKIRSRFSGLGLHTDLHVLVDKKLTVLEGHNIAECVKNKLLTERSDIVDVVVHLEPYE